MLILELSLPTDYATNTDRLWVEFPAPWPDAIVSGTLECATTFNSKVRACHAINGVSASNIPAKIYFGGITVTSASNKLLIRGIVNPPNKDSLVSLTVKYHDTANEKLQEISYTNIFTTIESATVTPTIGIAPTPSSAEYWASSAYAFPTTNADFNIDTTDRYFMNIAKPWTTYITDNPANEATF